MNNIQQIKEKIAPYNKPLDVNTAVGIFDKEQERLRNYGDIAGLSMLRIRMYAGVCVGAPVGEELMRVEQLIRFIDKDNTNAKPETLVDMVKDCVGGWEDTFREVVSIKSVTATVAERIDLQMGRLIFGEFIGLITKDELKAAANGFYAEYERILSLIPQDDLSNTALQMIANAREFGDKALVEENWQTAISIYQTMLFVLPSFTGNPVCKDGFALACKNLIGETK